jgi:hypothetical protein
VHDEVNDVYTLDVVGGEQVSSLNIPSNGNAIFVGWYLDKDYSVLFDGQKTITEDVDIYAKWQRISTTTTTIRYIDEYGNELLDSVIVEGIPGQYMAAVAQTIKGYSPVNLAAKVLMQDGSVINFVYKSLDSLWYQVQYVLKDGTVIAQDPIQRISNLDEIKIYANVPNGWKLADEKDQDKVILSAGISSNPDQPTLISILLEMPKVSGTLDDPEEESPEEKAKKTDAPAEPKQDAKSETKSQVKTAVPAASMWAWMAGISAGMFGILKKRKFK